MSQTLLGHGATILRDVCVARKRRDAILTISHKFPHMFINFCKDYKNIWVLCVLILEFCLCFAAVHLRFFFYGPPSVIRFSFVFLLEA